MRLNIKVLLLLLPMVCSAQFSFTGRGRTYKVTVSSESSSGLGFPGHWLYQPSVIVPSTLTNNQYILLFNSVTNADSSSWPTAESIFMQTSTNGLNWGSPTAILSKASNICDMIDARPIWDGSKWHVYVQAITYSGSSCGTDNQIYEATGTSLSALTWYGSGGTATALGSDAGNPGIGEDHQWFNTANYGGPKSTPIIDFYNDWNFTGVNPSYCPTCTNNGTPIFAYLSANGETSFNFWYYTSPAIATSFTSGAPYVILHPDVLLGGTLDQSTQGPPGFSIGSDCQNNAQVGRGVGFYPTPVPPGTLQTSSLPGQFEAGTFSSSVTNLIYYTRLARNPYGFLDKVGSSPNTWTTFLYYNSADEKNGTTCIQPTIQSTWQNNGGSGNPSSSWAVSKVTITEQ